MCRKSICFGLSRVMTVKTAYFRGDIYENDKNAELRCWPSPIGTFCKPSSLCLQIFFSPSIEFDSTLSVLVRLNFFIFSAAFWRASIMSFLSSSVVRSSARTKSSARQIHSTYLNYKLQLPRHGIINYTLNSPFSNHFITVPTLNHQKPRLL